MSEEKEKKYTKFSAEILVEAMEVNQVQEVPEGYKWTQGEWDAYAKAIDTFGHSKGCAPIVDDSHLPKRLGQIRAAYEKAGIACPRFPDRPKKVVEPDYETMVQMIQRRAREAGE